MNSVEKNYYILTVSNISDKRPYLSLVEASTPQKVLEKTLKEVMGYFYGSHSLTPKDNANVYECFLALRLYPTIRKLPEQPYKIYLTQPASWNWGEINNPLTE